MTPFTSGTSFAVALLAALTAGNAPLLLTVALVSVACVMALAGLARGRKRPISRRNLLPFQRSELALKLKPLVKERAKAKQQEHGNTAPGKSQAVSQKSDEVSASIRIDGEISKMAGVSRTRRGQTQKKTVWRYQHQTAKAEKKAENNLFLPDILSGLRRNAR